MSGDLISVTLVIRNILTGFINLLRVQLLECNRSLNYALKVLIDLDINNNLTCRSLRSEGQLTMTDNSMLTVSVSSLVTQLSLKGVLLTRNQISVGNSVLNYNAGSNLLSIVEFSLGLDLRLERLLLLRSRRGRLRTYVSSRGRSRFLSRLSRRLLGGRLFRGIGSRLLARRRRLRRGRLALRRRFRSRYRYSGRFRIGCAFRRRRLRNFVSIRSRSGLFSRRLA